MSIASRYAGQATAEQASSDQRELARLNARVTALVAEVAAPTECCRPCTWPDTDCYVNGPHAAPAPTEAGDPRPCKGRNTNVCVAEGCFNQECRTTEVSDQ